MKVYSVNYLYFGYIFNMLKSSSILISRTRVKLERGKIILCISVKIRGLIYFNKLFNKLYFKFQFSKFYLYLVFMSIEICLLKTYFSKINGAVLNPKFCSKFIERFHLNFKGRATFNQPHPVYILNMIIRSINLWK